MKLQIALLQKFITHTILHVSFKRIRHYGFVQANYFMLRWGAFSIATLNTQIRHSLSEISDNANPLWLEILSLVL